MPLTQEELQAIAKMVQGTVAEQLKATNDSVATLTKAVDVVASTMAQDKKNAEAAAAAATVASSKDDKGTTAKPLTAEDVQKAIRDALGAQQQQTQVSQQRDAFIGQHLAKLPGVYKAKLGSDPAKWADEAKAIQSEFEADFKTQGGTVADVGGATRTDGGQPAAQAQPDLSKLSPMQKIERGMNQQATAPATAAAK